MTTKWQKTWQKHDKNTTNEMTNKWTTNKKQKMTRAKQYDKNSDNSKMTKIWQINDKLSISMFPAYS